MAKEKRPRRDTRISQPTCKVFPLRASRDPDDRDVLGWLYAASRGWISSPPWDDEDREALFGKAYVERMKRARKRQAPPPKRAA